MIIKKTRRRFTPLTRCSSAVLAAVLSSPVVATEIELLDGQVTGNLDSRISWGGTWRLESPDLSDDNGDINENDGKRANDTGLVSNVFRFSADLELNYENYGAFIRGTAFYDSVMMDGKNDWLDTNARQTAKGIPDQTGTYTYGDDWSDGVKENQGKDARIQDAYVYGYWDIFGMPVDIRFGKQVVNWGEGLFYADGINTSNAFDLAAGTLPGSQIKDLLIPQTALLFDIGLSDKLSFSAYYQFDWESHVLPGRGTFHSGQDVFIEGSDFAYDNIPADFAALATNWDIATGGASDFYEEVGLNQTGDFLVVADTSGKKNASNNGQFGVSLKYLAESLNDTEFGFYYIQYNSHAPYIDAQITQGSVTNAQGQIAQWTADIGTPNTMGDFLFQAAGNDAGVFQELAGGIAGAGILGNGTSAGVIYPEDIRMFGVSFSTVIGGTSVAGELTYRPNMPIWIDDPDNLIDSTSKAFGTILSGGDCFGISEADPNRQYCISGPAYNNYTRVELWTGSVNFIHSFGPTGFLSDLNAIGEAAFEQISGLGADYDRYVSTASGPWNEDGSTFSAGHADDRLDRFAWGYTLGVSGTMSDVLPGVNLYPGATVKHDVSGNSHLTGNFKEDSKGLSLSLGAGYQDFSVGLNWYTDFDGDKEHISASMSYSF
ncbi:DUF1302 domain-containing protein [Kistimonas scapharcae]|uniref:DUF1302 domain-containing protein n=1 Tax=Kistimonas scapharcae TaxID=1036133 RepID=A0ABP8V8B9_9GAMM